MALDQGKMEPKTAKKESKSKECSIPVLIRIGLDKGIQGQVPLWPKAYSEGEEK